MDVLKSVYGNKESVDEELVEVSGLISHLLIISFSIHACPDQIDHCTYIT